LIEAFFVKEEERGCIFWVRRQDFTQDKRTLNIIDEVEERLRLEKEYEEAEAAKDMTYDQFLARYLDHIEGRAEADPRNVRPVTADENNE